MEIKRREERLINGEGIIANISAEEKGEGGKEGGARGIQGPFQRGRERESEKKSTW